MLRDLNLQCLCVCIGVCVCVVCILKTLAMILIYKSSLKPFSHNSSITWGQCWCICSSMITSWHQHSQSLAFDSLFYELFYIFCVKCHTSALSLIYKSTSPNPITYIVFLKKYLPWLNSSTCCEMHLNMITAAVFIGYGGEKLFKRNASLYCYDRLPPAVHLVLYIPLQW